MKDRGCGRKTEREHFVAEATASRDERSLVFVAFFDGDVMVPRPQIYCLGPSIIYGPHSAGPIRTFNAVVEAYFLEMILTDICTDLKQRPDTRLQAGGFK